MSCHQHRHTLASRLQCHARRQPLSLHHPRRRRQRVGRCVARVVLAEHDIESTQFLITPEATHHLRGGNMPCLLHLPRPTHTRMHPCDRLAMLTTARPKSSGSCSPSRFSFVPTEKSGAAVRLDRRSRRLSCAPPLLRCSSRQTCHRPRPARRRRRCRRRCRRRVRRHPTLQRNTPSVSAKDGGWCRRRCFTLSDLPEHATRRPSLLRTVSFGRPSKLKSSVPRSEARSSPNRVLRPLTFRAMTASLEYAFSNSAKSVYSAYRLSMPSTVGTLMSCVSCRC